MSTGKRGEVRVNHGRWARLMAGIVAGVGMLATLPAQAAPIPPVYELQLIPFDDLVIPVYAPFQPVGTPYYADFNGDGITDLFIQAPTSDGKSYIFLGRADGTYGIAAQSWSGTFNGVKWGADVSNIYIGDFNADGRADIILEAKTSGATSAMLFSSANGHFDSAFQTWVQQYPVNPNPNPYTTTTVGATAGSFAVGPSGAATYSIPVSVPPGINGMQPGIALNYNSQGGNGVAGVGWSISGLSTITRCGATIDRDGFKGGVNLDGNDKLCLDGQRLVPVSTGDQTAASGICANQTEYRTEMESFTRVIACGTKGSGPEYFKVWSKNGALTDYGNSTDSAVTATNTTGTHVVTWAINRTADTNGNYMTFSYVRADGTYYIKTIDYTGNGSTLPNRKVIFDYTTPSESDHRTDIESSYTGGSLAQTTYRLKQISTQLNSKDVHKLDLTYEYGTSGSVVRSRIKTVNECGMDSSGNCVYFSQPLTFDWTDVGIDWTGSYPTALSPAIPIGDQCFSGDLDGDGKTDMWCYSGAGTGWNVSFGTANGFSAATPWSGPSPAYQKPTRDYLSYIAYTNAHDSCFSGDLDGDGRTDMWCFLLPGEYGGQWNIALSRGDHWDMSVAGGLNDNYYYSSLSITQQCVAVDWNGDAKTDMLCFVGAGFWNAAFYDSEISNWKTTYGYPWWSTTGSYPVSKSCLTGDHNGDGRTDLWCYTGSNGLWEIALSTSAGQIDPTKPGWGGQGFYGPA